MCCSEWGHWNPPGHTQLLTRLSVGCLIPFTVLLKVKISAHTVLWLMHSLLLRSASSYTSAGFAPTTTAAARRQKVVHNESMAVRILGLLVFLQVLLFRLLFSTPRWKTERKENLRSVCAALMSCERIPPRFACFLSVVVIIIIIFIFLWNQLLVNLRCSLSLTLVACVAF